MAKKPDQDKAVEAEKREAERKRRVWIETAAGLGLPADTIAVLMDPPMDPELLKVQYATELAAGPAKADLDALVALAAGIKKGNMTAIVWWTKARMGWTEKGPGEKEKPAASETAPPTAMPTASHLSGKILSFRQK